MFSTSPRAAARPLVSDAARIGLSWPVHPGFRRLAPPVIVVGMHGSGTSAVSQVLEALGVHMGSRLDDHAEAHEFWELNEQLLYQAGASWHRPEALTRRLEGGVFRSAACARLSAATYRCYGSFAGDTCPEAGAAWGWKDPRSSLTLPLWLQLFPQARVVHVLRDPEAAARSIHRRARREAEAGCPASGGAPGPRLRSLKRALLSPGAAARFVGRRLGLVPPLPAGDPCLDLDHCRELAEHYLAQCRRWREHAADWTEVRYEDLLRDPAREVRLLARFTGLETPDAVLAAAAARVRPGSTIDLAADRRVLDAPVVRQQERLAQDHRQRAVPLER